VYPLRCCPCRGLASRFEPNRWTGARFLGPEYAVSEAGDSSNLRPTQPDHQQKLPFAPFSSDAPICSERGSIMTRSGSCYKCENCRGTSGCS
jgi:ribonucleoside-diphosphate reductase alpha chain